MTSVRTDDLALIDHHSPTSYDDPESQPVRSTRHITKWTPQRILIILTAAVLIILVIALVATLPRSNSSNSSRSPLNVILLIPDGTGPATFTLGRQLRPDKKLHIDAIITGTVQTYSSNWLTTDSAAAATAMACGVKTYNGAIGVNSTGHPVGTVLEAAKARGMRTGVIVTSRITHATPASFTSHVMSRESEKNIAEQQFNQSLDFGFGGGLSMFNGTLRNDSHDLWGDLTKKGYHTMSSRTQFDNWKENPTFPAFGLFDVDHLPYEIDRNPAITPSLSEMVAAVLKGLEETATSGPGFFMLIEGSRIDMAGHNNDVAAHARELLAFDDAVGEALAFAKKYPNTLLLSAADHETGGLTLGLDTLEQYNPSTLLQIKSSAENIDKKLVKGAPINATLMEYANVTVTNQEYITIQEMIKKHDPTIYSSVLTDFIGKITSERFGFGWGTTHHTGIDVNLYSYGPAEWVARLTGNYQNTHIADVIASYLNLDLSSITRTLNTKK